MGHKQNQRLKADTAPCSVRRRGGGGQRDGRPTASSPLSAPPLCSVLLGAWPQRGNEPAAWEQPGSESVQGAAEGHRSGSGPWLILVLSWMQHELRAHGRRARRGEQRWRAGKRRFRPRLRSSRSFGSRDERWRPQQVAEGHCSRASLGRREQSTGGCRKPLARPASPPRGAWPWYREGSGGRRPRAELRGGAVPTLQLCRLAASSTV